MSDSVWPHRWQPMKFPHPWDSPGKNTGVGCHFFLQCMKVKSESESAQSCPSLSDPMDCGPPGSSVHGIFQARVLEWGAIAFSVSLACSCNKSLTIKIPSLRLCLCSRMWRYKAVSKNEILELQHLPGEWQWGPITGNTCSSPSHWIAMVVWLWRLSFLANCKYVRAYKSWC